jgi:hypothetical protein
LAKKILEILIEHHQKLLQVLEQNLKQKKITKEEYEVRANELANQILELYEKLKNYPKGE